MIANNVKELASATLMQAVKDYIRGDEKYKASVLKDLRSPWMDLLTGGMAAIVATQLENHSTEITKRMKLHHEMED